jgi:hypothetical protein
MRAVFVAMEAHRSLPDALDQVEHVGALLVAHGVAEDAPKQTDVIAQPGVFQRLHVVGTIGPDFGVGRHGLKGHDATLQKLPSFPRVCIFLPQRKMKMEAVPDSVIFRGATKSRTRSHRACGLPHSRKTKKRAWSS